MSFFRYYISEQYFKVLTLTVYISLLFQYPSTLLFQYVHKKVSSLYLLLFDLTILLIFLLMIYSRILSLSLTIFYLYYLLILLYVLSVLLTSYLNYSCSLTFLLSYFQNVEQTTSIFFHFFTSLLLFVRLKVKLSPLTEPYVQLSRIRLFTQSLKFTIIYKLFQV